MILLPLRPNAAATNVVSLERVRNERCSDSTLVLGAQAGDLGAQRDLYDRFARPTLARAVRLVGRFSEAEDIVQEAFLEAFRDLSRLNDTDRFDRYLMGILAHRAHRRFRRERLLRRLGFSSFHAQDATLEKLAPGADQETLLQLSRIDQVIRTLAPDLRLAWMLRMVEGCSLDEVAEQGRCSLATAKRRIASAQQEVAKVVSLSLAEAGGA